MRERSRVEVELHILLLSPLHPACELVDGYLVAVNLLATELTVNLMQVKTEGTSQKRVHLLDVLTQLVDITSLAGIVACTLYATRCSFATFKTYHIVSLPAVQGDRSLL